MGPDQDMYNLPTLNSRNGLTGCKGADLSQGTGLGQEERGGKASGELLAFDMSDLGVQVEMPEDMSWIWLQAPADKAAGRPALDMKLPRQALLAENRLELPDGRILKVLEHRGRKKPLEEARRWTFRMDEEGARVDILRVQNPAKEPRAWIIFAFWAAMLGTGTALLWPSPDSIPPQTVLIVLPVLLGAAGMLRGPRWWVLNLLHLLAPPGAAFVLGYASFLHVASFTDLDEFLSVIWVAMGILVFVGSFITFWSQIFDREKADARFLEETPPKSLAYLLTWGGWARTFGAEWRTSTMRNVELQDGELQDGELRWRWLPGFRRLFVEQEGRAFEIHGLHEHRSVRLDLPDGQRIRVGPLEGWPLRSMLKVRRDKTFFRVLDSAAEACNQATWAGLAGVFLFGVAQVWRAMGLSTPDPETEYFQGLVRMGFPWIMTTMALTLGVAAALAMRSRRAGFGVRTAPKWVATVLGMLGLWSLWVVLGHWAPLSGPTEIALALMVTGGCGAAWVLGRLTGSAEPAHERKPIIWKVLNGSGRRDLDEESSNV